MQKDSKGIENGFELRETHPTLEYQVQSTTSCEYRIDIFYFFLILLWNDDDTCDGGLLWK